MFIKKNNVYNYLFYVKKCCSLLFTNGHYIIIYNKRNLLLVFKACTKVRIHDTP